MLLRIVPMISSTHRLQRFGENADPTRPEPKVFETMEAFVASIKDEQARTRFLALPEELRKYAFEVHNTQYRHGLIDREPIYT